MRLLEARNRYGISAAWRYSSGALHGAWDIPTPTGTPLHSDVAGTVAAVGDGAPNNRPGQNPGSGSPSNWVLIHTNLAGRPASLLVNHLSAGVKVRPGQRVKPGDLLGTSGNSGNSTGPHTHVATWTGWSTGPNRYEYLNDPDRIIWQPDKVLAQRHTGDDGEDDDMAISDEDATKIAYAVWSLRLQPDDQAAHTILRDARAQAKAAADKVINFPVPMGGGRTTDLWALLRGTYEGVQEVLKR